MKVAKFAFVLLLLATVSTFGATFSDWQYCQDLQVSNVGMIRLSLPVETLDAALSDLSDLRVTDGSGNEVPYLIQRPVSPQRAIRDVKSFDASIKNRSTILLIETGLVEPFDGITLESPALNFIKAVQVEGSSDKKNWKTLAQGQPIFRQPNGISQLHLSIPKGVWPFLRFTVDDARSQPIPFVGVKMNVTPSEPGITEPVRVKILNSTESADGTRLALALNGAHLDLSSLRIETPEPIFTRKVTLAAREIEENIVREKSLALGTVFRIALDGQSTAERLEIPLNLQTPEHELLLLIQNDDSPPLKISAVTAFRRPVFIIFAAQQTGTFTIFTGNRHARTPHYDLASLGSSFKNIPVIPQQLSTLVTNPNFNPTEPLPDIPMIGAALDVSAWPHRKAVHLTKGGVQQLDLDLEIISHAQTGFSDLRLVSDGKQIPFILEHTSLTRSIIPQIASANDPKKPGTSRWALTLPERALPLVKMICTSRTALFERNIVLYEDQNDERGEKFRRTLGEDLWRKLPDQKPLQLVLNISSAPKTDSLSLEINNGDNPAIDLENFQFFVPVTRLLFKAAVEKSIYLYYGNARADFPRYDLNLVAPQLLASEKSMATLAESQPVKPRANESKLMEGKSGIIFWIVLGLVVVVLLIVISRLLPKPMAEAKKNTGDVR